MWGEKKIIKMTFFLSMLNLYKSENVSLIIYYNLKGSDIYTTWHHSESDTPQILLGKPSEVLGKLVHSGMFGTSYEILVYR